MKTIEDVPLILRREIEARIAGPLIRAFARQFGKEEAYALSRQVIAGLAAEAGAEMAKRVEVNDMQHFIRELLPVFKRDALEVDMREHTQTRTRWDTTRCQYAEMYKRLGMEDIGTILSCERDAYLFAGYNPALKFERTKTIMEGKDCCDFSITHTCVKE